MTVWAFNWTQDKEQRKLVYESLMDGKSRFGWSYEDEHDLRIEDNWTPEHGNQLFLLDVEVGDWIVHVNTPEWGQCVAARVASEYGFDSGLNGDFRHNFDIDRETIQEFDRNDENVLPTVNLRPRRRYHRVKAVDDFMESLQRLGEKDGIRLKDDETPQEFFLKDRSVKFLREISDLIHKMHRSKNLESFMKKVFESIEGVTHVHWNGKSGSDCGADLIISMSQSLGGRLQMGHRIVVQVKSFEGEVRDTKAVEQVEKAIEKYRADAGIIVTTGTKTEELEKALDEARAKAGDDGSRIDPPPIDLLASEELSLFVIEHAPGLLFRM